MEELELLSLQSLYESITNTLQTDYVIPHLVSAGVLNKESIDEIDSEKTDLKKARRLLEFVREQDTNAFWSFVRALRENGYDFLAEAIEDYIKNPFKRKQMHKKGFPQAMILGGVPVIPSVYIQRTALVNRIRLALKKINDVPGWVVVHGMGGSGKSVESAMAVRDPSLFGECFPGGIFWLTIGQIEEARQLMKMQNLCRQLDGKQVCIPNNIEDAKNRLRQLFVQKYPKSLLVLDDVWSSKIIGDFDIQCRILVTTRDSSIIEIVDGNVEIVPCSDNLDGSGFTLEQTKELFAKCLDCKIEDIPLDAAEIHDECNGLPIAIAVIGAVLKKHKNRWGYYRDLIRQHKLSKVGQQMSVAKVIEISVENLEIYQQEYYKELIVFDNDIKVPAKVLSVFWDTTVEGAEDIMDEFVDKSLAIKEYSQELNGYCYCLHQLHYHYLKENNTNDQNLHRKLIDQYHRLCNGKFYELPDDKYIFWFLANHLHKAGLNERIPEIFLNLIFILTIIERTGTANLLYTYHLLKYQNIIKEQNAAELADSQRFVETNTHLLIHNDIDPLQLALCQPSTSHIYKQTLELVKQEQSDKLYFNWCTKDFQLNTCKLISKVHSGRVYCAQFIANGTKVISASGDHTIRIWYSNTGGLIQTLRGHTEAVRSCILSKDGSKLITSSDDHTVRIWKLDPRIRQVSGKAHDSQIHFLRRKSSFELGLNNDLLLKSHSNDVLSCDISSDGLFIVSASIDKTIRLWDANNGKLLSISEHQDVVNHCCFSPDNTLVASCSGDKKMKLWDVESKLTEKFCYDHKSTVSYCSFSHKRPWIASASDNHLKIWQLLDSKCVAEFNTGFTEILCCDFSNSSNCIAAGTSDYTVFVWNVDTQEKLATYKGHSGWIYCVRFSEDANMLLSASDDETVRIWDLKTKSTAIDLKREFDIAFTEDSLLLAAPDNKNHLKIISGYSGKTLCKSEAETSRIRTCRISHNMKQVAYGCDNGTVKLLFLESGQISNSEVLKGHLSVIKRCQFTKDDDKLVTCSFDCSIRLWSDCHQLLVYNGHQAPVIQIKLFKNDERILSASHDGTLRVWDLQKGNCIHCLKVTPGKSVLACDVSPDDCLIAAASEDKMVWIFNTDTGDLVKSLSGHSDFIRCCQFSADSSFIISGDDMGILKTWDVQSLQAHKSFDRHCLWVTDVMFSPDGKVIVSAAENIKWWSSDGKLLQTFQVQGSFVRYIRASEDFKVFVTVDSTGLLYILERIMV